MWQFRNNLLSMSQQVVNEQLLRSQTHVANRKVAECLLAEKLCNYAKLFIVYNYVKFLISL